MEKENIFSKMSKKTWIIIGSIAGVVLLALIGLAIVQVVQDSKLDASEEYVLKCVQKLKKTEGSISLTDDILYSVNDKGNKYVIVEYRSKDGLKTVYFENQVFLGTDDDYMRLEKKYDNYDDSKKSSTEYKDLLKRLVSFSSAKVELAGWNLMANATGRGSDKTHLVSAKKIGKRLGISYPRD